jgi:hypothetical protein
MTAPASTRVITPEAILSYPHLFEAWSGDKDSEPKFSAAFVFLSGSDLSVLKAAVFAAGTAKWGDKFTELVKTGQVRLPFRTDGENKGYPAGSTFINARSKNRPGVVEPYAGADGRPAPLTDFDKVYAGCRVRGSVTAFAYDTAGNKGVSFALNNVQYLAPGERLDNRVDAKNEFGVTEDSPASLGSLDDLL